MEVQLYPADGFYPVVRANGEQLVLPLFPHIGGRGRYVGSPTSRQLNDLCLIDGVVGVRSI